MLEKAVDRSEGPASRVTVDLGARSYDVRIGQGLIEEAGDAIAALRPDARVAVVTDGNVAAIHAEPLMAALERAGVVACRTTVAPGETSKSLATLERVLDELLAARLGRNDLVVALGGGVIGDLAGFAAAILLRGIDFVQVPTTLLAQVDSSVGGKTGINARAGKNLIGAFHQPLLVLADTATLDTLPQREFAAGYAEVVKTALIDDAPFLDWLEAHREEIFAGGTARTQAVARCCAAKARIVAEDEREGGRRALLNLGHTFGHALEAAAGYDARRLVHGEAVAVGIVLAHDFSAKLGLSSPDEARRAERHLRAAGLPTHPSHVRDGGFDADTLLHHMKQDKKAKRGELTFILTHGIGRAFIAEGVEEAAVREFLEDTLVP